jgi:uncharacterized protein (DUF934 family)
MAGRARGEDGALPAVDALPAGKVLVPFALWQAERAALVAAAKDELGVWLAPDSEPAELAADFGAISLIAVDFPGSRRPRLQHRAAAARALRLDRRAARDRRRAARSVAYMKRCGFDAFAVRADKDIHDALNAFGEFTQPTRARSTSRRRCSAAARLHPTRR